MPNHIVLASGAVVAVSVVVATAVAIYENPELRRYTDDMRRRIAMALQSLGEGIAPAPREPMFNRPEDAEGFLESRRGAGAEPGVDADEETRKRQREELLYWNSMLLKKQETEQKKTDGEVQRPRGASFDDFMRPVHGSDEGAYVFHSGAEMIQQQGGLRQRGEAGAGTRGFAAASAFANPFTDEFYIDHDEDAAVFAEPVTPAAAAAVSAPSDIYSATTKEDDFSSAAEEPAPLIELDEPSRSLDDIMLASQNSSDGDAYASIQAWARDSSNFYSPLPETPAVPRSEASAVVVEDIESESEGQLTPTDSVSVIGSHEARSQTLDVLSQTSGLATPASWSEVGSSISESEGPGHA